MSASGGGQWRRKQNAFDRTDLRTKTFGKRLGCVDVPSRGEGNHGHNQKPFYQQKKWNIGMPAVVVPSRFQRVLTSARLASAPVWGGSVTAGVPRWACVGQDKSAIEHGYAAEPRMMGAMTHRRDGYNGPHPF